MICEIERRIGQQVKRPRQALKLTQAQLAKTLGLSIQKILLLIFLYYLSRFYRIHQIIDIYIIGK
jgi:transcriptional regulator with XRE-family HTH domain